ncbi:hypothetical protein [Niastella sp. OAS944]|uniref:hypothetical protein n=1 Tax=Niastella sp. OAS944 TaxID=2664089 RepID=UPI0034846EAD|nr:hypothetical protein [Chitinophagaceae bacterium OAS944]
MIQPINSYKELLEEKARLKALLVTQELQIREDWQSIKEELKPAMLIGATLRKVFTRSAGLTAAQLGINMITDGFVKKVILRKAGWLIRLVVPLLIKNYASHIETGGLVSKIKQFFRKKEKEEEQAQETGMDAV